MAGNFTSRKGLRFPNGIPRRAESAGSVNPGIPVSAEHGENQNLRDRIAAALRSMTWPDASGDYPITYEGMADAVIEALGIYEDEMGTGATRRIRIISDWEKP